MGTKALGKGIGIGIFSILLFGMVTTSQFAFATEDAGTQTGNESPAACEDPPTDEPSKIEAPMDMSEDGIVSKFTLDAGSGKTITSVCIKTGGTAFVDDALNNPSHSGQLGDGMHGIGDCYEVMGVPGQIVMVKEKGTVGDDLDSSCKDISHLDFVITMNGGPPGGFPVGGEFLGVDSTALLLVGTQFTAAWLVPALVAAIGIGIVLARKY